MDIDAASTGKRSVNGKKQNHKNSCEVVNHHNEIASCTCSPLLITGQSQSLLRLPMQTRIVAESSLINEQSGGRRHNNFRRKRFLGLLPMFLVLLAYFVVLPLKGTQPKTAIFTIDSISKIRVFTIFTILRRGRRHCSRRRQTSSVILLHCY